MGKKNLKEVSVSALRAVACRPFWNHFLLEPISEKRFAAGMGWAELDNAQENGKRNSVTTFHCKSCCSPADPIDKSGSLEEDGQRLHEWMNEKGRAAKELEVVRQGRGMASIIYATTGLNGTKRERRKRGEDGEMKISSVFQVFSNVSASSLT